ncbi:Phosphatidylinositol 4,5-bisphosphate 3-kinase catalytic subunit gamma isoform [Phytophthora boehmeriae]|uniref:phosphatidylinositol 3-kinase n=1 Tax=Phytophthora boehmeriae TaxID=109152 RepID=A0A8T1XB39_9STRA|nr:Phosphatidylinositol 4,5-bisphosphate 3-kinase catalytic subunit gamma isoform [Phytophthora boehmeriae]
MLSVLQGNGGSANSVRSSTSSFISAAYNNYENGASFRNVDVSLVPSFEALNPYANAGRSMMSNDKRWQPVPNLYHSKESLYFRSAVGKVLKKAHEEISPSELEVRANTPEFKVEEGDWIAHNSNQKNQFALITPLKTVARIPANLIVSDEPISLMQPITNHVGGFIRKKGEKNKAFKRRYMELNGSVLMYYKKKPEKNGIPLSRDEKKALERGRIDLDRVSSLQPMESKSEPYGILLVTTARTWAIIAESEGEYQRWLKALCDVVKFSAVHVTYKRMFQLQEVSAKAITDVRMVVTTGDTVGQIVEHIFNCYEQALDAAPLRPYNPAEYRLKITGYRDYMIDRYRVLNEYVHVRECLLTKKTIRLTVIHESVIQETAMMNLSIGRDLTASSGSMDSMISQFADMYDGERSNSLQMTTLGDEWERQSVDRNSFLPSGIVQQPFAIRIRRVLNIPRTTCVRKRSSEEAVVSRVPLTSSSVIVRIELYDGGQLLENAVIDTNDVRLKAQRNDLLYVEWDDPIWHKFNIDICNVTRTMRVQLTVFGVKKIVGGSTANMDATEEKMLVTGINAFDVDDTLTQGQLYVHMYNNLHSCIQGPVPHVTLPNEPMIQVELSRFDAPIKFDWSDNDGSSISERSHRRSIITSSRSVMLRKEGWLQKVGNFSSLTRWRRRWFVVDQSTCTLSYADDETAPRKLITLRNCSVTTADDMNQKFTTAPVNKGTRKLRQTWCFKVRPMGSSRDYIISAETKQDREEWMLAIQTVSKGDSSISDFGSNNGSFEESSFNGSTAVAESPRVVDDQLDGKNILECVAQDRRDSTARSSANSSSQRGEPELNELRKLILLDPLYRFSPYQKEQLWMHREEFTDIPAALPRILSCVHWDDRDECEEALKLLPKWSVPDHQAAYIELLNGEFAHEGVRKFAVKKLGQMADTTFSYFLPQLVQAIKFENHHVSPLSMMLIERAIKNPNQIGFDLFWSMKVEAHNDQYRERYGTILNAYLDVCSSKMRAILKLQDNLFSEGGMLERICQSVKAKKKDGAAEMKRAMQQGLEALNEILPGSFQLPLDPRIEVGKIIVSKCRVMDSAKKPLWLVFENAEEGGDPVTVMFKAGDDVRQDCLTLQLIRLMDEMWRDEGLDLAMEPYKCVATSPMTGILQMVPNSVTTAEVHMRDGMMGTFKDPSFSDWIRANNPDPRSRKAAVDLFGRSAAGYCVATCVLGIGDRHNDNIMIASSGRYFHIDFGHFLGHLKYYKLGIRRERTPFVFTNEMAYVLGGVEGKDFAKFVDTACTAYCVLRKHMHLLVSLLLLMVPADMPELTGRDDINHIVTTLAPEVSDERARESFEQTIHFCLDSRFKRFDNYLHNIAHAFG